MTNGTRGQERGYMLASVSMAPGEFRRVARFQCTACPATHDLPKVSETVSPEGLAKAMRRLGWEADAWNASWCKCPAHTRAALRRRAANDPDSELKQLEAKMVQAINPAPVVSINRDPTADQRREIRKLLEEHFDEGEGCYRDGWSDELVATRAQIPMVVVQKIRDTSFGPIRVTPEIIQLRKDMANLKVDMAKMSAEIEALMEKHDALAKQASAIEAKLSHRAAA